MILANPILEIRAHNFSSNEFKNAKTCTYAALRRESREKSFDHEPGGRRFFAGPKLLT